MDRFDATQIIPMDDLHWNEDENKMVLLSDENIEKLLIAAYKGGTNMENMNEVMEIIRWAEHILSGQRILEGVNSGRLKIYFEEGFPEPIIAPIKEEEEDEHQSTNNETE